MKYDRDPKKPSVDMVMHVVLAVVFLASVCAWVQWPELLAVLA
jgi:hypothetical protein